MKGKCIPVPGLIYFSVILFCVPALHLSADDRMVIDFDTLVEDVQADGVWQNEASLYRNPETGRQESLHPSFWKNGKIAADWDKPYAKTGEFTLTLEPISEEARRYPGQWALRVSGALNSEYPTLEITPPFPIPAEDRFEGYGLIRDIGPIRYAAVDIQNNGRPFTLTLEFEDELGNPFNISFDIERVPGAWYQYMFSNPFAYLESRFPEFHFDYIRLVSIWVYARDVQDYWTARYREMAPLTEDDKIVYERNNPAQHVRSDIDFLLKDIFIGGMHGEY